MPDDCGLARSHEINLGDEDLTVENRLDSIS